MILGNPKLLLAIAIFLLAFGIIMPFLMAIRVVESSLFLNFLSFFASVLGLFLGVVGIAFYRGKQNKKDDDDHRYR